MELTLFSPAITCEKCIEHIEVEIASVSGARFLSGEPKSKSFSVSITRGDVLDAISSVLTESGYPLGPATPAISSEIQSEDYTPSPVVVPSECGATISFTCPCGSTDEIFEFDRGVAEQPISSCCDHYTLVGPAASWRLLDELGPAFQIDSVDLVLPWEQTMEFAIGYKKSS